MVKGIERVVASEEGAMRLMRRFLLNRHRLHLLARHPLCCRKQIIMQETHRRKTQPPLQKRLRLSGQEKRDLDLLEVFRMELPLRPRRSTWTASSRKCLRSTWCPAVLRRRRSNEPRRNCNISKNGSRHGRRLYASLRQVPLLARNQTCATVFHMHEYLHGESYAHRTAVTA